MGPLIGGPLGAAAAEFGLNGTWKCGNREPDDDVGSDDDSDIEMHVVEDSSPHANGSGFPTKNSPGQVCIAGEVRWHDEGLLVTAYMVAMLLCRCCGGAGYLIHRETISASLQLQIPLTEMSTPVVRTHQQERTNSPKLCEYITFSDSVRRNDINTLNDKCDNAAGSIKKKITFPLKPWRVRQQLELLRLTVGRILIILVLVLVVVD